MWRPSLQLLAIRLILRSLNPFRQRKSASFSVLAKISTILEILEHVFALETVIPSNFIEFDPLTFYEP